MPATALRRTWATPRPIGATQTIPGTDDDLDESLLLAPMLFDDEVIGVIVLAKLGLNQFGPDDLRVLEIYASIAAQAMANADATERLRAQSEALARQLNSQRELLRVTESILTTLDTQTLLEEIAERLAGAHPRRQHLRRRPRRGRAHGCARSSPAASTPRSSWPSSLPDDAGVSGEALRTGEAQLVQDELADPTRAALRGPRPARRRARSSRRCAAARASRAS